MACDITAGWDPKQTIKNGQNLETPPNEPVPPLPLPCRMTMKKKECHTPNRDGNPPPQPCPSNGK